MSDDELLRMWGDAILEPGDYAITFARAVERAARAAAFREAAEVCQQRKYPEHDSDMDAECSAYNSGCEDCADALRARAEGGA